VILEKCSANHCDFSHADLTGCNLKNGSFVSARFEGANMCGVSSLNAEFFDAWLPEGFVADGNPSYTDIDAGHADSEPL
jgi:uncharacterized protein YjbI with pentapeptide repeats